MTGQRREEGSDSRAKGGACSKAQRQEGRGGLRAKVGPNGKKQVGRLGKCAGGTRWNISARPEGEVQSCPGGKAWNVRKQEPISTENELEGSVRTGIRPPEGIILGAAGGPGLGSRSIQNQCG